MEYHLHFLAIRHHIDIYFFAHNRLSVCINDHFSVFAILFSTVKENVSVKRNLTCRRLIQAKQCTAYCCLSTAGLANQTKCFSRADGKGNIVHCFQRSGAKTLMHRKILLQMFYFQQIIIVFLFTAHCCRPPVLHRFLLHSSSSSPDGLRPHETPPAAVLNRSSLPTHNADKTHSPPASGAG